MNHSFKILLLTLSLCLFACGQEQQPVKEQPVKEQSAEQVVEQATAPQQEEQEQSQQAPAIMEERMVAPAAAKPQTLESQQQLKLKKEIMQDAAGLEESDGESFNRAENPDDDMQRLD